MADWVSLGFESWDLWRNLGIASLNMNRPLEAISSLRCATALTPDDWVSWRGLGEAYRALGDFENLVEAYERIIEILIRRRWFGGNFRNRFVPILLGSAHAERGDNDGEIGWYERATQVCPSDWWAWQYLAAKLTTLTGRSMFISWLWKRIPIKLGPSLP